MREYIDARTGNKYNIPEKEDLKIEGVVVPMGGNLMVKICDDILFDTGITPTDVYDMDDTKFNDLVYGRAVGFIESFLS
jgi:hypothetical protein